MSTAERVSRASERRVAYRVLPRSRLSGRRGSKRFAKRVVERRKWCVCLMTRRPLFISLPSPPRSFRGWGSCRARSRPSPRRCDSRGDRVVRGGLRRRGQHALRERDHLERVPLFVFRGFHVSPVRVDHRRPTQHVRAGLTPANPSLLPPPHAAGQHVRLRARSLSLPARRHRTARAKTGAKPKSTAPACS